MNIHGMENLQKIKDNHKNKRRFRIRALQKDFVDPVAVHFHNLEVISTQSKESPVFGNLFQLMDCKSCNE